LSRAELGERAQMALDTINQQPTEGIPSWLLHVMELRSIERLAACPPGSFRQDPDRVYMGMQHRLGTCLLDQYLAHNPLSMGNHGYENKEPGATTGLPQVVRDGIVIDSPEAVVAHMEQHVFPGLQRAATAVDEPARTAEILRSEAASQLMLGSDILKSGYGFVMLPALAYSSYGYEQYFAAYALYPDVMERHFELQADVALRNNRAAACAYTQGDLPPLYRLDHDMADSRGTLIRPESLEQIWFPHLARCIEPLVKADVRLLWHCDGNLMAMVPRLLDCGVSGFQGFQYEDGMDYEKICRMRDRQGRELIIIGGVSVTRTLPFGSPDDVRREIDWLVTHGPRTGLFLGGSSSIAPGTPYENLEVLAAGLQHYRERGRG
jgi:hypothetical protein